MSTEVTPTRPRPPESRRLRLKRWMRTQRYIIRQYPHVNAAYRVTVAVIGTAMILAGIVMVPLPTPGFGWVMIFAGLGVLSTEFAWAHRITHWLRKWLHILTTWYGRRSWPAKVGLIVVVTVLILVILWLAGILGTSGDWVGYHRDWLHGPFRSH